MVVASTQMKFVENDFFEDQFDRSQFMSVMNSRLIVLKQRKI